MMHCSILLYSIVALAKLPVCSTPDDVNCARVLCGMEIECTLNTCIDDSICNGGFCKENICVSSDTSLAQNNTMNDTSTSTDSIFTGTKTITATESLNATGAIQLSQETSFDNSNPENNTEERNPTNEGNPQNSLPQNNPNIAAPILIGIVVLGLGFGATWIKALAPNQSVETLHSMVVDNKSTVMR